MDSRKHCKCNIRKQYSYIYLGQFLLQYDYSEILLLVIDSKYGIQGSKLDNDH